MAAKVSIDLIGDADPNDAAPKPAPALKDSSTARSIPKKGTAPSDLHKMRVRKSKPPSSNKDSNSNSEKKNSSAEVSTGTWACHKCTKDNPVEHSHCGVCYRKGGRRDKQKVAIDITMMGAFSHGKLHGFIFGSFTTQMLLESKTQFLLVR